MTDLVDLGLDGTITKALKLYAPSILGYNPQEWDELDLDDK